MTLLSAREIEKEQVLLLKNSDERLIRSNDDLSETINKGFGKDVWILEADSNDRRFLENLFHPTHLESVNLVWLPDGSKLTRIMINKSAYSKMDKIKLEKIKKISMVVRQIDLIIEVDD